VVIPSCRWIARISLRRTDPDLGVEGGERFVEEEHLGFDGERARECDPLLLAARHLVREAVAAALEVDQLEQLADALVDGGLGLLAHLEPEPDVAGDRHVREEPHTTGRPSRRCAGSVRGWSGRRRRS